LEVVDGRGGEVAFLESRAIAQVVLGTAAVPASFVGIDVEEAVLWRCIEANAVEDEELRFGPEESLVGDAGLFQVRFGANGDLPGIARVGFVRDGVANVADQYQRGRVAERIHEGGVGIGQQQHVRFVDRLPPADGAAVEAESFLEGALFQFADGITHVLPKAGKIGETQIENFGVVLVGKFQNTFWIHPRSLKGRLATEKIGTPWATPRAGIGDNNARKWAASRKAWRPPSAALGLLSLRSL
jgi:hypothetical protein